MRHPSDLCRVDPARFQLSAIEPELTTGSESKKWAKEATKDNLEAVADLQYRLYAESKQSLLIVLQGIDAAGKDGTIRKVYSVLNPQGCRVAGFKQPSALERSHDFLWRIHLATPRKGEIGIFNRSHYEDVLVVRVKNIVPREVWEPRYEQINQFESLLHSSGTHVLKFFLYISKEEQKERFQARLDDPTKNWKFSSSDLKERARWDDYLEAFQDALVNCSTPNAPWYVIPANNKWYRNWLVSSITRTVLEDMNPQIPAPEAGLKDIRL